MPTGPAGARTAAVFFQVPWNFVSMNASNRVERQPEPPERPGGGEEDLVEGLRMRSPEAMEMMVRRHQERIFNVIFRLCGHREDAMELTQETFCRAIQSAENFRGGAGLFTWLYRIAVNLTISHQRKAKRGRTVSLDDDAEEAGTFGKGPSTRLASGEPGPDEIVASAEVHGRIMDALGRLDDDHRIAVILRDLEGLDYRQIADIVKVPVGTVKSRIHRARMMLRTRLGNLIDAAED